MSCVVVHYLALVQVVASRIPNTSNLTRSAPDNNNVLRNSCLTCSTVTYVEHFLHCLDMHVHDTEWYHGVCIYFSMKTVKEHKQLSPSTKEFIRALPAGGGAARLTKKNVSPVRHWDRLNEVEPATAPAR